MLEVNSLSAIEHILHHRPERVLSIKCAHIDRTQTARVKELLGLAKSLRIPIEMGGKQSRDEEPLSARLKPFEYGDLNTTLESLKDKKSSTILALDHLQDPQNLGALARTAEALGADAIVMTKDRSATVSAGVYAASVGAIETIPLCLVANLNEALRKMKNHEYWIIGAALGEESKPLADTPDFDRKVIVLGTELEGLNAATIKTCDWLVEIPLKGKVQSLNVSAAGAILLHHFCK